MYTIEVYFVNQPDEREPFKTFTCEDSKLPDELSTVQSFIIDTLNDNPNMLDAVEKVIVNGNKFSDLPTLQQIAQMSNNNPLLGVKLKRILEKYPEILKLGFDGHDMYTRGISGFITIMYNDADFYKMYAASQAIDKLYNLNVEDNDNTIIVLLNSTTDSGFLHTYVRGVDF